MLILYDKNEIQFTSNGVAVLDGYAFDDELTEELNGIFKYEFSYPMFSENADKLILDNIVRVDTPEGEQPFFIIKTVNNDGYLRVTAYHIFYKLAWKLIEDINIVNLGSQAGLNRILENTGYTGISDITKPGSIRIVRYNVVEALLDSGKDNTFINRFGGEIKRDKFIVDFKNRRGRTYTQNPVEIRYSKNLESYEVEIDSSNVATRVMPIGFNGLLLPEKYVTKAGATDIKTVKREYPGIKAIEDVDNPKEDELPLADAHQALRNAVQADFNSGKFDPQVNYKISFVELSETEEYKNKAVLERLYMGDDVRVIHKEENIDVIARIISYRWSALRKEYIEIELGNYQPKFTDIKTKFETLATAILELKSIKQLTTEHVTEMISGALGGTVAKYNGTLYAMDTDDINTAQVVAVWNRNGLGFSSTGINGPFETAITRDGHILGKFITANSITTNQLASDVGQQLNIESNEAIQARVTRQQLISDPEIKNSITQAVTPAVVTSVRQSQDYQNDLAEAAKSRDLRLVKNLIDGLTVTHNKLLIQINEIGETTEITTAKNSLISQLASINTIYSSILADNKVTDEEWTSLDTAIATYGSTSTTLEKLIVQGLYKEIGNLAQSTNEAFSKMTPEYIWNSVSGTETWTNAMSQKADLDSVGKTVDKKIVDYDNNTISTMRNTIQTINEKVIEDGELILDKTKNFTQDVNGLTIDGGGASALRLSNEMISFLMNGVTGDYWKDGWFYTKNVEVLESLRLPNHTLVKIGTSTAFRPTGR